MVRFALRLRHFGEIFCQPDQRGYTGSVVVGAFKPAVPMGGDHNGFVRSSRQGSPDR